MKQLIIILCLLSVILQSCSNTVKEKSEALQKDPLLVEDSIKDMVIANSKVLIPIIDGDISGFKEYISELNDTEPVSIPFALYYIDLNISPDYVYRDSVFYFFRNKFIQVMWRTQDSLNTKYGKLISQIENDSSSSELSIFKKNLNECGLRVFLFDGSVFIEPIPDFFYQKFHDKVSEGLLAYLYLQKDESGDYIGGIGGESDTQWMLISYEEVFQRLVRWGSFLNKYPQTILAENASKYADDYLHLFMFGLDNGRDKDRVFDRETNTLRPEIKLLYEKMINEHHDLEVSQTIADYYNFLSKYDFKGDNAESFLERDLN